MELLSIIIPSDFILQQTTLSWKEILYGIQNQLINPAIAIKIAENQIGENICSDNYLIELAALNHNDSVLNYVIKLAETDTIPIELIEEKWLYLLLYWLFLNSTQYVNPLEIVENIYCEFNYPKQIVKFIRYMPNDDPDLGNKKLNELNLYKKWGEYLNIFASKWLNPPAAAIISETVHKLIEDLE